MDALPNEATMRGIAAREAIDRLQLLTPAAQKTIEALLPRCLSEHPRSVSSSYRKIGEQVSANEKRMLKIRTNGFMSVAALAEITDLGLKDPIRAHETTLLRASFTMLRHRSAMSAAKMMAQNPELCAAVQYEVFHPDACARCKSLDSVAVPTNWGLLPLTDCACVTAPYGIRLKFDWIESAIKHEDRAELPQRAAPTLASKIKKFFGRL